MTTDLQFALHLNTMCDECHSRVPTPGHIFCGTCYSLKRAQQDLASQSPMCLMCRTHVRSLPYDLCDNCWRQVQSDSEEFPAEDASYEELLQWEAARKPVEIDSTLADRFPCHTLHKRNRSSDDSDCLICIECMDVGQKVMSLPCLHQFHEACIRTWLIHNKKCPICNLNVKEV